MYNCVAVVRDNRRVAVFPSIATAERYIAMWKELFPDNTHNWHIDWCYIEGVGF
jgi:hypothetical protein